ncbi:AarF/ABC1/UbiB kinase family protein [Gordonia westfalica]|uniref:AarF/ABC1/UbiB kinase family protein n=1 Tax=Gordonia westfalica TaxID=158898 RepID=A0ABU2GYD6_9ACTN|nr:AarF/ABC1/UbiB kinase family protein [Gordonia westfalica]MDS1116451.1 AarF/ABC1/UbiB kinase family protein [Gordonia westfalica]
MTDNPRPLTGTDRFGSVRAGRVRRTVPVVGFAARAAGGRVVAGLRNRAGDPEALDRFHHQTAERYAEMLGHSKGVLMKAGQLLSTYDVEVGGPLATYQAALQRLQSDAPPMDFATTRDVVEADLGTQIKDAFDEFSPDPIAAASIGQVHRATLIDGTHVAVKVQYPGVARAIRDDLANTELLATFLKLGMSLTPRAMRTDQRSAAAEVAERIAEELDYRHEARSIRRFAELYRDHPFVRVPDVVDSHSGDRVITMTFLDGLGWAQARTADQELRNRWAEAICYFGFGAYRHSNLFNADPHPGNYRFREDGTVGFVDFGCVKQFPEWVRRGIVTMFRATCDGDRHELYRLMIEHGFLTADTDLDVDHAYQWWAMMASSVNTEQPHTFVPADSTGLVQSMFDDGPIGLAARKMHIPSDYVMLTRINLGINAILSELGATLDTRDQLDCVDGVGEPKTAASRAHAAWARKRGLPFGLTERS